MAGPHTNRRSPCLFRQTRFPCGGLFDHKAVTAETARNRRRPATFVWRVGRRAASVWGDGEPCRSSGANPMFGIFSVRLAGVGAISLALFTAGLVSVPSFPTTGASLPPAGQTVAVNRAHKADRLPILGPAVRPEPGSPAAPSPAAPLPAAPLSTRPSARIPAGCDRAFSPISSPRLAHVFKRCMA